MEKISLRKLVVSDDGTPSVVEIDEIQYEYLSEALANGSDVWLPILGLVLIFLGFLALIFKA